VVSRAALSDFRTSGADDLISGAEDFLPALPGYGFRINTGSMVAPR